MSPTTRMIIRNARIWRAETRSFSDGELAVRDGLIEAVTFGEPLPASPTDEVYDAAGRLVIPGLIDVHTHGRAGGDFGTADDSLLRDMAHSYLLSGVTTVMPTLASAPLGELEIAIDRINSLADEADTAPATLPHIPGIHLEGRYLNVAKRGAHAPELLAPLVPGELEGLLCRIRGSPHISAAFELDESGEFLRRALALGATAALGHSNADYATATALLGQGVSAMTHLFNAMPPLHHRDGGAVAAGLLSHHAYCELICDGVHIAPEMVRLAYTLARERLVLITDSMEATGCPDGEYRIAGMPVTVKDGRAVTHDGAIAGSTLSLWQAVQNLVKFADIPFEDALYAATLAPAREVGIDSTVGSLDIGKRADLIVLDHWLSLGRILCGGVWVN